MNYNEHEPGHDPLTPSPEQFGMKWHKFLIYFGLWASAFVNTTNGYNLLTGKVYGSVEKAAVMYEMYPSLGTGDKLVGVLYLLLALFAIYTRFELAGFKRDAPKKLLALYVGNLVVGAVYVALLCGTTRKPLSYYNFISEIISSIIGCVLAVTLNKKYYDRREALFIH